MEIKVALEGVSSPRLRTTTALSCIASYKPNLALLLPRWKPSFPLGAAVLQWCHRLLHQLYRYRMFKAVRRQVLWNTRRGTMSPEQDVQRLAGKVQDTKAEACEGREGVILDQTSMRLPSRKYLQVQDGSTFRAAFGNLAYVVKLRLPEATVPPRHAVPAPSDFLIQ